MSWFFSERVSQADLARQFMELMHDSTILRIPGAHDALSALMAKRAGFSCLYLSGAAYTASLGLPDIGLITSTEVAHRARDIVRAASLPLLVDVDTGFGGPLMAARMALEMVEVGVAAIQIEDQKMPKRCGHLDGKSLIDALEMEEKIAAIKAIAPSLVVVARTDAYALEGLDGALQRAERYVRAGADAIFPEALDSRERFCEFAQAIAAPLLANMTEFGKTSYYTAQEFEEMGYAMVIFPASSMRMAAQAYETLYGELMKSGTQVGLLEDMLSRDELYEVIKYERYAAFDPHEGEE